MVYPMNVEVRYLDERFNTGEFVKPSRATEGSAAIDLIAAIDEPISLSPDQVELIPTGISINIQDPNYAAVILPRSGLGHKKGLILGNTVGLIDSDYQGQLMISAWNRNSEIVPVAAIQALVSDPITINPGDRIAQLLFIPVAIPTFVEVDSFSSSSERGEGGFGHTGVDNDSSKRSTDH